MKLIKEKGIEHYGYKVNDFGYTKKLSLTKSLWIIYGMDGYYYPHLTEIAESIGSEEQVISLNRIQTVEELIDLETKLKSII